MQDLYALFVAGLEIVSRNWAAQLLSFGGFDLGNRYRPSIISAILKFRIFWTIAQQRVRMEGWRQERLGSRAGTHREEEKNKKILTGRKKEKHT